MPKTHPWSELADKIKADPVRRARIEEMGKATKLALALGQIREGRGATQKEVAGELGVSQARVSGIEHGKNLYLSTLQDYVEALGGRLELRAVFPDQIVSIALESANEGADPSPNDLSTSVEPIAPAVSTQAVDIG